MVRGGSDPISWFGVVGAILLAALGVAVGLLGELHLLGSLLPLSFKTEPKGYWVKGAVAVVSLATTAAVIAVARSSWVRRVGAICTLLSAAAVLVLSAQGATSTFLDQMPPEVPIYTALGTALLAGVFAVVAAAQGRKR